MMYEYQCDLCKKYFDIEQKITDNPIETCPDDTCRGPLKKLISKTSFVLKGKGWFGKGGY